MRGWYAARGFWSTVATLKLLHESSQSNDSCEWHGVVETRAHPADRAMSFKIGEPGLPGVTQERLIKRGVGKRKGHIHPRAAVPGHRVSIETGAVNGRVQKLRFDAVPFPDRRESAVAAQPFEDEARDVPGEGRRRVEHGVLRRDRLVIPHHRGRGTSPPEQIIAHDHDAKAGRADVLLRPGVDQGTA